MRHADFLMPPPCALAAAMLALRYFDADFVTPPPPCRFTPY